MQPTTRSPKSPMLTSTLRSGFIMCCHYLSLTDLCLELNIDIQGTKTTRNVLDIRALYENLRADLGSAI
jgi:hypothetical protein